MSNIPISSLPAAISLDGSELVPIVQGGTTKRTTVGDIIATTSGFVPDSRTINTQPNSGLNGGGALSSDLFLKMEVNNLAETTAMAETDFLAVSNPIANTSLKITPPNFYKTVNGLTHKSVPDAADRMLVYSISDADSRYSTVSEVLASAGSLPSGGTTGQPLIKRSNTDFDTEFATLPVIGGGTGAITLTNHGIVLGQGTNPVAVTAAMTDGQLLIGQTGADPAPTTVTGDVTINSLGVTAIGANKVTNAMLRQSSGLSVIGNAGNTTADVADITAGSDFQILRRSGTGIGFGSINLSQSGAVGASILQPANGGTGIANSNTLTLGGNLTTIGAFSSSFTMTGATAVTFPTSGTLATTSGASIPTIAQGDLLYGSATNTLSTLAKNTTATRYLSNTGTSNNPAWAQIALTTGVTGTLPVANGGTGVASNTAYAVLCGGTTTTNPIQSIASVGTSGQVLTSNGAGALPTFQSVGAAGPVTQVTGASASITAGTPAVAVVRTSPTATALSLPTVASQGNVPIHIFDWSTGVTGHTITITPNGSETIMLAATWPLFSNAASLAGVTLYPSTTLSGWYIAP